MIFDYLIDFDTLEPLRPNARQNNTARCVFTFCLRVLSALKPIYGCQDREVETSYSKTLCLLLSKSGTNLKKNFLGKSLEGRHRPSALRGWGHVFFGHHLSTTLNDVFFYFFLGECDILSFDFPLAKKRHHLIIMKGVVRECPF